MRLYSHYFFRSELNIKLHNGGIECMEQYLTESKLSQNISEPLKKKGIVSTTDTVDELNGKSAIIDTSNFQWKDDQAYIDTLEKACKSVNEYANKIIYIPVTKWYRKDANKIEDSQTPLGAICRFMKKSPTEFKKKFSGFVFIFYNNNNVAFSLYPEEYSSSEYKQVLTLFSRLLNMDKTQLSHRNFVDTKSPVKDVVDDKSANKEELASKKQNLVDAIMDVAEDSNSEEEAWNKLEEDEYMKSLILDLEEEDDGRPKFSSVRTARMAQLNNEFTDKKINGVSIKEIISTEKETIPSKKIPVSSINEEWNDVKFVNFQDQYDINKDILNILKSFSSKSYPISIIDIKVEDTSTNQDYVDTYTVQVEDGFGKRSTLTFDIPKFKNNRFMRLRGNEKVISGQLLLLPCLKTDEDTVQCVSNYKKIFIRRYGLQGRSYPTTDRILKSLRKLGNDDPKIKVFFGDNRAICSKYELPVDYIDLASEINRIETKTYRYIFNQDEYYNKYKVDRNLGIPYAVSKIDGSIKYFNDASTIMSAVIINELLDESNKLTEIYNKTKPAAKLNYSEAKIMMKWMPLAVVLGYSAGMDNLIKMITGRPPVFADKRTSYDPDKTGVVKFSDGYLLYPLNYSTSMLLNGLSACPTESYSIKDTNKRSMWLDFLDIFGGRILSDGLDNFVDLFIDPITEEVCKHCRIPSNYFDMLIYANNLLADNKYNKHTDISGNRYRTNEIVAGYFYQAICKAYEDYKLQVKRGRKVGISMKRSAVIDAIMKDPMFSDLSILNPLFEIESKNSASFKGLSGMNDARSYGLDKRTYDDSMINKLALSTGFASNVGINRQTTIDMDIDGARGYIKQDIDPSNMSITKSFSMSEAITPFGTTRDDPFRSAMTFIQTSKHSMRTAKSMPLLITNGADEAMPYISSDTFSYKAKEDGVVIEVVPDDYMIVQYNKPVKTQEGSTFLNECIDLKEEVKKNSDGGFFITLKLSTDLKEKSKFKKGQIIAWDNTSYSNKNGESDNLAYNLGVLAKVAIMNTDEGFEDSTSVSEWLSEAMATDVVVESEKDISKNTNIYSMAKIGQKVQEGDPLIVFQNSFDEKDANILLKNITDAEYVSDLGRIKLKSKYTGVVQDIKIYRTCELDEMSDSLKKIVTAYEQGIKAKKSLYKKYNIPGANLLEPDYKMQPTGIMKNNQDGVKIVFYIAYNDKLSVGDKTVAQSANKGVVKNIFPDGLEPFSEYRPEEKIHALYAARSFNARMVTSVWTSGAINKCMIELDRQVKEIMGIDWTPIEDME